MPANQIDRYITPQRRKKKLFELNSIVFWGKNIFRQTSFNFGAKFELLKMQI